MAVTEDRVLEVRVFRLRPGTREKFHDLLTTGVVDLLARHGITLVDAGPSALDDTGYYVIRAFPSVEERAETLSRHYASEEWLSRYDEAVMGMIDSYHTVVLPAESPLPRALLS
jgi:NIPSNAP